MKSIEELRDYKGFNYPVIAFKDSVEIDNINDVINYCLSQHDSVKKGVIEWFDESKLNYIVDALNNIESMYEDICEFNKSYPLFKRYSDRTAFDEALTILYDDSCSYYFVTLVMPFISYSEMMDCVITLGLDAIAYLCPAEKYDPTDILYDDERDERIDAKSVMTAYGDGVLDALNHLRYADD